MFLIRPAINFSSELVSNQRINFKFMSGIPLMQELTKVWSKCNPTPSFQIYATNVGSN